MKSFFSLLRPLRERHKKIIIKLFALLGYKLNSYHSFKSQIDNLLTENIEQIIVYNQFVPTHMRHPVDDLKVGYWLLSKDQLSRIPNTVFSQFYGNVDQSKLEGKEFYFPLSLSVEYPGFIESLGKPIEILDGILNPSGRSIWLTPSHRDPVCLKIDTMQLFDRQFFSERALLVTGLIHSIEVTSHLQNEPFNCSEDGGGHFQFNFKDSDGHLKRYTYLLRHFDFEKLDIRKDDFLVPLVALLSTEFWLPGSLSSKIGIKEKAFDFLMTDLSRCFADLINNSLTKTFIHFEVHQQNLTLHIRKGRGIKLIYHDLQDTVFDTITYLLDRVEKDGLSRLPQYYDSISKLQKNYTLNAHGHLLTHRREVREYFTVVSIYRRYIRNFGSFNKSVRYFANSEVDARSYFSDKSFEREILKNLSWGKLVTQQIAEQIGGQDNQKFLEEHLFWSIDQFHKNLQRKMLNTFLTRIQESQSRFEAIPNEFCETLLQSGTTLYSNGFPIHLDTIDFTQVSKILKVYEDKVLLITYRSEDFLIVRF